MLLFLAAGLVWSSPAPVAAQQATPVASPEATVGEPAVEEPTGPMQVTVGFYLTSIYSLDQQAGTFYADFYLWMRWQGENDPTLTVEMLNNIERWGLTMTPVSEEAVELPSGEFLQQFHVQGQFVQPLAMDDFPLDEHGLTIELEDLSFATDSLVYVPDLEQSGISPDLRIPGWNVTGWSLKTAPHKYATDFGETGAVAQEYSNLTFTLEIERPPSFFRWKLFLPLVIVLLLGCSVLLVHPTYTEVRLAGPATALLTLVFLQQTYTSSLPENGSLVLLDKIYALAYALVIGLIITTIVTSHWVRVDEDNTARAVRLDRIAAGGLFGLFLVGTVILLLPVM
jgi:hypothetical protein